MKTFCALFIIICFSARCNKISDEHVVSDGRSKAIHINNYTGHLIRRGSDFCGPGFKVNFVLESDIEKREQVYEADTYRTTVLKIERGDRLIVTAYEVRGHEQILLARNTTIYDPPSDEKMKVRPTIVLCPSDRITFYDISAE